MKIIKIATICVVILTLASCKKDKTDLDKFFADAKNIPPQQIDSLPEINPPEIYIYEPEGLRDPFSNDLQQNTEEMIEAANVVDGAGPDLNRRKETLESYPLDSLYMVGTYLQKGSYWGLIEDPEGVIHRVSLNQHIGQNYGEILVINEDQIDVSEWMTDGLGGWIQREASIALREE